MYVWVQHILSVMSNACIKSWPCKRKLFTGAFTSKSCCVRSSREGIAAESSSELEFFRSSRRVSSSGGLDRFFSSTVIGIFNTSFSTSS